MRQTQWFVNWGKLSPPGQSGFSLFRTASTFATLPLTSEIWVPQESVSSTHTPRHLKVDSFYWVTITIICSSVRTREILCRVSVKRHLVLRTLRLKRFESSHCFRLAWSWVWDEKKSSGFLEEKVRLLSSAYILTPDRRLQFGKSLIYIKNKRGAKDRTLRHPTMYKANIRIDSVYHCNLSSVS